MAHYLPISRTTVALDRFPSKVCPRVSDPRVLFRDELRNVKQVPFHRAKSLFLLAMHSDDVEEFSRYLEMGDFVKDKTSPNARTLYKTRSGIYHLMDLCLVWGAGRCLQHLCEWCRQPEVPFKYDLGRLQHLARQCAIRYGRPGCLLALADTFTDEDELRAVHALCLASARTPEMVRKLALRFPPLHDRLPFLVLACADPFVHPSLIEALAEPFVSPNRLMETCVTASVWKAEPNKAKVKKVKAKIHPRLQAVTTTLAIACSTQNLAAISTLLRLGADPFEPKLHMNPVLPIHPLLVAVTIPRARCEDIVYSKNSSDLPTFAARLNAIVSMLLGKLPAFPDGALLPCIEQLLIRAAGRFFTACRRILYAMVEHNVVNHKDPLDPGAYLLFRLFRDDDSPYDKHFVPGITGHVALYMLRTANLTMDESFIATWGLFMEKFPALETIAQLGVCTPGPGKFTTEDLFMGYMVSLPKQTVAQWEKECDDAEKYS